MDFYLKEIFCKQKCKRKFSADGNGKYSFANFRISLWTGKEDCCKHGGPSYESIDSKEVQKICV